MLVNWRNSDHTVLHPLRTFLLCVGNYLNSRSSPTSKYDNILILMTEEIKDTWIAEVLIQYVRLNEKEINFKWFADIQKLHLLHIACSVKLYSLMCWTLHAFHEAACNCTTQSWLILPLPAFEKIAFQDMTNTLSSH